MSSRPKRSTTASTAGADLVEVGDVHLDAQRAPAHGLDLGHQVVGGARRAQPERDVGAGVGQGERDRPAEAARRAGDQGDLAARARSSGTRAPVLLRPRLEPGLTLRLIDSA